MILADPLCLACGTSLDRQKAIYRCPLRKCLGGLLNLAWTHSGFLTQAAWRFVEGWIAKIKQQIALRSLASAPAPSAGRLARFPAVWKFGRRRAGTIS